MHSDDLAVDRFAAAMKEKLAKSREKGRGGWDNPEICSVEDLGRMLIEHVGKGDPVDVANFCMMLHERKADVLHASLIDYIDKHNETMEMFRKIEEAGARGAWTAAAALEAFKDVKAPEVECPRCGAPMVWVHIGMWCGHNCNVCGHEQED